MSDLVIATKLLAMLQDDEEMRKQNIEDPDFWDEQLDTRHAAQLKRIITIHGWPTIKKVGRDASHAAWLIVQHADHDQTFQQECLDLMKALPEHEILQPDIAFLEDRILTRNGRPQLYGTQFRDVGDKLTPFPITDPENLEVRRKKMNLEPFQDYIKLMSQTFGKTTSLQ